VKEPDYWNYFFWQEHVKRFLAEDAQHKAPFWTYLAAFPVAALPWSALIPAAVVNMDRAKVQTTLFRYAVCWFAFPMLFFSAASGKILTYILPCFAPFAILLSTGLSACFEKTRCRAVHGGVMALMAIFGAILIGLIVIQSTGVGSFIPYVHPWKVVTVAAMLVVCLAFLGSALSRKTLQEKMLVIAAGTAIFVTTIQLVLPDDTIEHKAPGALLLRNALRVQPETVLVSLEDPLRAVCWFYRRSDVLQLGVGGELAYGLAYPDGRQRLLDEAQFTALVKHHPRGKVVLVGKAKHYRNWKDKLPPPFYEDDSGPGGYVFAQY
jgi:4-amino-4-deoxy-L-arabinose transferase